MAACAVVALGVETTSYSELAIRAVINSCTLLHAMCNVIWVAAWFGYTSDESYEGHGHVQQC